MFSRWGRNNAAGGGADGVDDGEALLDERGPHERLLREDHVSVECIRMVQLCVDICVQPRERDGTIGKVF